jgi:hypothetical protein
VPCAPEFLLAPPKSYCPAHVSPSRLQWPFTCVELQTFPLRWQWYILAAPVDAAAFTILRSGHLPDPPFDGLPGHPDIPHLAHSCDESYRLWRHSDLTLPELKFPTAIFPGYKMSIDCLPDLLMGRNASTRFLNLL